MWIEFWSDREAEDLAKTIAPLVWPEISVMEGVPFKSTLGDWWELSLNNDHKLDARPERDSEGRRRFTFRDRYHNEERLSRMEAAIRALGAHDVRRV